MVNVFNIIFEVGFPLLALVFAVIMHELAHAYIADRYGDPTARLEGRITLNPLPHLDPVGSIIVPLFLLMSHAPLLVGWAKPVPIDIFNLRNPRKDGAIIALAGPATNLIIAIIASIILHILLYLRLPLITTGGVNFFLLLINDLLLLLVKFNVVLAVFNLIPVHPLDGFKIVGGLLPADKAHEWYQLERYGMIFLLFLLFPIFGGVAPINQIISPVISFILGILLPGSQII